MLYLINSIDSRLTLDFNPFREYKNNHTSDIVDVNWSTKNLNIILSASSDTTILIYNISLDRPIQVLSHPDIVSSALFKYGVINSWQ
jgi:WD40 repeat protein